LVIAVVQSGVSGLRERGQQAAEVADGLGETGDGIRGE
jgi:hypothetical protein